MNFFYHLKLEIAPAISASNEWKIETKNSVAQGLKWENLYISGFLYTRSNDARWQTKTSCFKGDLSPLIRYE